MAAGRKGTKTARQAAAPAAPPSAGESLLEVDDIQGNILAGFNKDHQLLVALVIQDRAAAKAWLSRITPHVSTLAEVGQFNRLFRAHRRRLGHDPLGLISTWANIAFSHNGLAKLTSMADADGVPDQAFRDGLPARAGDLGDTPTVPGEDPSADWVVGGVGHMPDILLIVASDDPTQLDRLATQLCPGTGDLAGAPQVIWRELGATRSDLPGHEHFGFKDGVSQPAVRGLVSKSPDIYLTERQLKEPAEGDIAFASPGYPLVWPGEFVFGYPSNNHASDTPVGASALTPAWIRNGSLLVFRRLRQEVAGFYAFLRATAGALAATPDFTGMSADRLGALLVGRWPSGAPVARTPLQDDLDLAADPLSINDFLFTADTPTPDFRTGFGPAKPFSRAIEDALGFVCPHPAHIRKVNPRDQDSDKGDQFDTLTRRILRRGIPFGAPLPASPGGQLPPDDGVQRGLHFLCYQTSIVEQFEILQKDWANSTNNPKPFGHDLIIGQAEGPREAKLATPTGGEQHVQTIRTFVTMTGGGYFFAPGIAALKIFAAL